MSIGTLLVRADASVEIGSGHAMRCLALAEAWQDAGGTATFLMAQSTPLVLDRLKRESFNHQHLAARVGSLEDADATRQASQSLKAKWVVIDGYDFDERYLQRVCHAGTKLLCIDDLGAARLTSAEIILNHNVNASKASYSSCLPQTQLLLGSEFALLRREFRQFNSWARAIPQTARTVLVSMGGTDPTSLTARMLREQDFAGLEPTYVFGNSKAGPASGRSQMRVLESQPDMASVMAETDMAVICAGGTLWECLFMGCATLTYTRDALQQDILQHLQAMGAAHWLGGIESYDPQALTCQIAEIAASQKTRKSMAERGRAIIDGHGAERVVRVLQEAR